VTRPSIRETDLRRILDLVDPQRCGDEGEFVPQSFLTDLALLIPACDVTFEVVDPYSRTIALQEATADPVDDDDVDEDVSELWWAAFWESCSYPQRSGDFSSVWRSQDSLPGVHKGPRWHEFAEAVHVNRVAHIAMSLEPQGTVDRRLILWRPMDTPFTEPEAMLLELIRPHLEGLYRRQVRDTTCDVTLTPRQLEVLRLVSMGYTNGQVARKLFLSEGTVRKHLENTYERLGVRSRSEAVVRLAQGA
jgi:DNA-binding CsgD family transcriptional regulator